MIIEKTVIKHQSELRTIFVLIVLNFLCHTITQYIKLHVPSRISYFIYVNENILFYLLFHQKNGEHYRL